MAYWGWFSFGGTEVISGPRFEAYASNAGVPGFRPLFKFPELAKLLGEQPYRSAFQDQDVPWVDPDVPDTYDFYGFYPTNITGLEDSSRTSTVVESTGDGGTPGRIRHATKQVVFSGFLAAGTDAGVDAGFRWLKSALLNGSVGGCSDGGCSGAQLCYLYAEPSIDPSQISTDCLDDYYRFLYRVVVNAGPTVTQRNTLSNGTVLWQVTFTAIAGNPFEYGLAEPIVTNFPNGYLGQPYVNDAGGATDEAGHIFTEIACPSPAWFPVFNPACPDLILPPSTPVVPIGCYTPPVNWRRRSFSVPASYITDWSDVVPLINIKPLSAIGNSNIRIRIFPDAYDPDDDPCAFCADMLVSYIPPNSVMTIDGRSQTVTVVTSGQQRRGDGLIFSSNGMPFTWPALSCGMGYTVVVDVTQTAAVPAIDFSLVPRNR